MTSSYLFDLTAPARHDRVMTAQAGLPDLELPAPQLPGCERIDVYLAQRGWTVRPRDVQVRDMVHNPETGQEGWAVYESPPGTGYWGARLIGFLRPGERPRMVGTWPDSALHIRVLPPPVRFDR
jgi:hypothetical protein